MTFGLYFFPSYLSFIINRIDMAETAGLVVGVVALASLFNTTVECFEFVQLGRSFGKDFQTSQLKLDSARLRLSRWGKSLDLVEDVRDVASLQAGLGQRQTSNMPRPCWARLWNCSQILRVYRTNTKAALRLRTTILLYTIRKSTLNRQWQSFTTKCGN